MSERQLLRACLAARGITAYQMLAHEGSVTGAQLEWQMGHLAVCGECRVEVARMVSPAPLAIDISCECARKLMNTLAGCGNDLVLQSAAELRAHWVRCDACRTKAIADGIDQLV